MIFCISRSEGYSSKKILKIGECLSFRCQNGWKRKVKSRKLLLQLTDKALNCVRVINTKSFTFNCSKILRMQRKKDTMWISVGYRQRHARCTNGKLGMIMRAFESTWLWTLLSASILECEPSNETVSCPKKATVRPLYEMACHNSGEANSCWKRWYLWRNLVKISASPAV